MSYSPSIHGGTLSSVGSLPEYVIEKDCHGASPNIVASIISYRSSWLANGRS